MDGIEDKSTKLKVTVRCKENGKAAKTPVHVTGGGGMDSDDVSDRFPGGADDEGEDEDDVDDRDDEEDDEPA